MILNLHHRKPTTHKMPDWMKKVFLTVLPKILFINRPTKRNNLICQQNSNTDYNYLILNSLAENDSYYHLDHIPKYCNLNRPNISSNSYHNRGNFPNKISQALDGIHFVNTKMQREVRFRDVKFIKYYF